MKKKLCILSVIIMIIGLIVVIAVGYNVDLKYKVHKSITVPIGEDFNISDISQITDEIFGKNNVSLEKAGVYNDSVIINVADVSNEQIVNLKNKINEKYNIVQKIYISIGDDYSVDDIKTIANEVFSTFVFSKEDTNVEKSKDNEKYVSIEANLITEQDLESLNNKINEKYNLTNKTSSISASNVIKSKEMPRVRLTDMAKQYLFYTIIATIIVLVYFAIRFRKLGIAKVMLESISTIVFSELLYMAIIAITRASINKIIIIAAFAIYICVLTYLNKKYIDKNAEEE